MMSTLMLGATAFTIHQSASITRSTAAVHSIKMVSPLSDDIWSISPPSRVEGNTLKTWDIGEVSTMRAQLSIKSEGRPVHSNVELWHTPTFVPTKMSLYTEDAKLRPINCIIETPKHPKTVAVFNTGAMEFPFDATVSNTGLESAYVSLEEETPEKIQGGRITSYTFGGEVESVQILLNSVSIGDRNMKARIELTQGPNQVKQSFEIFATSGEKNPFYAVIQTPGSMNTIRVINQNTVEFPFNAWVLPYEIGSGDDMAPVMGGF